jgi:hypothetical protein
MAYGKRKRTGGGGRVTLKRRRMPKRSARVSATKLIKRQIMGMADKKLTSASFKLVLNANNTWFTVNSLGGQGPAPSNLMWSAVGTSNNERDGKSLFAKYVRIKGYISGGTNPGENPTSYMPPTTQFRVVIFEGSYADLNAGNVPVDLLKELTYPSPAGEARWCEKTWQSVDTKKYRVVRDTTYNVGNLITNPGGITGEQFANYDAKLVDIMVKLNKKIVYESDNGSIPHKPLMMAVLPSTQEGTFGTQWEFRGTVTMEYSDP